MAKEPAWGCAHKSTSKVKCCSLTTSQHRPTVLEKIMISDLHALSLRTSLSCLTCYLFIVLPNTFLVLIWSFNSTNLIDHHPSETWRPMLFVTQPPPCLLLPPSSGIPAGTWLQVPGPPSLLTPSSPPEQSHPRPQFQMPPMYRGLTFTMGLGLALMDIDN